MIAAGPIVLVAAFIPALSSWLRSERSVALSQIRVGEVVQGDLERDVSVQGRIVAALHPTTYSPSSGIAALRVRAGEVVESGQILAQIDNPELASRLKQEESTLRSVESDLERQKIRVRQTILAERQQTDLAGVELEAARRGMARADRSRQEGIINDVEYERAQDDLRRAEVRLSHARENARLEEETLQFELRQREQQIERQRLVAEEIRRQVDGLSVRSPVAGLVSRLDIQDHEAVTPGRALVTVVDLSAFEVEILVPEHEAAEIGPGARAEIDLGGQRHAGTVRSISPEVEGSQVRGIVAFEGDQPQGLRQNQRVSTRLLLERRSGVLKVARGPFLETGGGRQAYRIDGETAARVPIRTGATSVTEVEILSGLEVGDRIIISDTARFEDAVRVYLRD